MDLESFRTWYDEWALSVVKFFQVQQSQQERQVEPIHLPKGVERETVTFLILVLAFHHHLAQVDLVAPCQVQDVVLHQVVVAKTCLRCLDLVCFVGPNQRFLPPKHRQEQLCGERPTSSWKLVASVSDTAQSFLDQIICNIVESMFGVYYSVDCHRSGTTSCQT